MANDESKGQSWEYPETNRPAPDPAPQPAQPTVREELSAAVKEVTHPQSMSPERPRVADDLLMLFGRIAGLILVIVIILTSAIAVFRPEADISSAFTLINTQLSIIIGAVLGYAAHPNEKSRD